MSLLNKHFWKFFVGLLAIVILGFLVIYGAALWPNYDYYISGFYGGETPEKTLNLFLSAIEKKDLDLAGRYFDASTGRTKPATVVLKEESAAGTLDNVLVFKNNLEKVCKNETDFESCTFFLDNETVEAWIWLGKPKSEKFWKIYIYEVNEKS